MEVHAQRPGRPKFQGRRGFCGAGTNGAGLMPGSGETNTVYCVLVVGLLAVSEICRPGSSPNPSDFLCCRSGLTGLFDFFFAFLLNIILLQAVHSTGTESMTAKSDVLPSP